MSVNHDLHTTMHKEIKKENYLVLLTFLCVVAVELHHEVIRCLNKAATWGSKVYYFVVKQMIKKT